ncbi:MAG: zinc transporter ZupT [Kiritimatiellia bacterium]
MEPIWIAFGLTLLAGLATGIGSVMAFFVRRTNHRFLSVTTGFSAGVMLYVSFVEIFHKGNSALVEAYGERLGAWLNALAFFAGIALIGLIDYLVPDADNPHATHDEAESAPLRVRGGGKAIPTPASQKGSASESGTQSPPSQDNNKLLRAGLLMALAIGIHNFPEGAATFLAALSDTRWGLAIAVAIALHNIPEGISVSVPIFYATGKRRAAFVLSLLSGLAEPIGAVTVWGLLRFFAGGADGISSAVMGAAFGSIAGVMVYISIDELLPISRAHGSGHDSILGLVSGMALMALSLLLMR